MDRGPILSTAFLFCLKCLPLSIVRGILLPVSGRWVKVGYLDSINWDTQSGWTFGMSNSDGQFSKPNTAATQPVCPSVLTPAQVIQTYDDVQWEEFILEYLGASKPPYVLIERKGGAGDKGRDIVAHLDLLLKAGSFDIFQCKAYLTGLTPSEIWVELGKLCVFTFRGDFPIPRCYRFVAPKGVGTSLGDLLQKPAELRSQLIENWPKHCEGKISKTDGFALIGQLKSYVENFDFSIVSYVPVNVILDQHRTTKHWHQRFKRDYPDRPKADMPPTVPTLFELQYIQQLLAAYADHLKTPVPDISSLNSHSNLVEHLHRSRTDYFMADSLNRFYRDQFPAGAFDHVVKHVFDGVIETAETDFPDALARVRETVKNAATLTLSQTEYTRYVEPGDKKGICHHLANDNKLRWVK